MSKNLNVKICGLTDRVTVEAAVKAGASHLGFIFYPPSPRSLTPKEAGYITSTTSNNIKRVAVIVDARDDLINGIIQNLSPHILQLHGSENIDRIQEIKEKFKLPIMKTIKVANYNDIKSSQRYSDSSDFLLFDAKPPIIGKNSLPGGNGISFDWALLRSAKIEKPWFLSGGIHVGNVHEAIKITGSESIDISSGVEDQPGVKNVEKIEGFMKSLKEVR
ncbi:phosphoribosylanthranilate isomerase [Rhodospirillaceae bacterium]|nr:phosphoribosylanthranilate isomerase [Rhodospirillaceae bacterium]